VPSHKSSAYAHPHERMAKARRRARLTQWFGISLLIVGLVAISIMLALLVGG
jgi:hypothetical protein